MNKKNNSKPRIKTSSKPPVREALPCAVILW